MEIYVVFVAVLAAAVFLDARRFDWNGDGFANEPWKWAAGVVLFWVIVAPLYLMHRRKRPRLA